MFGLRDLCLSKMCTQDDFKCLMNLIFSSSIFLTNKNYIQTTFLYKKDFKNLKIGNYTLIDTKNRTEGNKYINHISDLYPLYKQLDNYDHLIVYYFPQNVAEEYNIEYFVNFSINEYTNILKEINNNI